MFKGLVKKLVATAVVAASAFLAVIFLGLTLFYALSLKLTPLGAAAARLLATAEQDDAQFAARCIGNL